MMSRLSLVLLACLLAHAHGGCLTMPNVLSPDTYPTKLIIKKVSDGVNVTQLCPGVDYTVTIVFPEARQFMLQATSGIFNALTGSCTNHTSSTVATYSVTMKLAMPCDITGNFVFQLASKMPQAATFLGKNFSLPVKALTSCPLSRCQATNGTGAFAGLPVFDLFKGFGILPSLVTGNKLNFTVTSLPKVLSFDSFFAVLSSLAQFKMAKASLLADPTLMLSVLQQLCGAVNKTTLVDTKLNMLTEVSTLLNLWPNFWNTTKTASGLDVSTFTDALSSIIPNDSPLSMFETFATANKPAESLLSIVSVIGNMAAVGTTSTTTVSTSSFMDLLGSYTSLLTAVKNVTLIG